MDRNNKIKPIMSSFNEPVIPAVFDESLSYMEMVAKIKHKVNETVDFVNTKGAEIDGKIVEANNAISELSNYDEKVNFALNNLIDVEDKDKGVGITRRYYSTGSEPPILPTEVVVAKQADVDALNNVVLPAKYEMPVVGYDKVNQHFTFSFFDNKNNIKEVFAGLREAIGSITTYCDLYFSKKTDVGKLDYSTEEQDTGSKWIDGKPIYSKTIDCGVNYSIQNGNVVVTEKIIPNGIDTPIKARFYIKSNNDSAVNNVNFSFYDNVWHYFSLESWEGRSDRHVYFYIEYTKNNG